MTGCLSSELHAKLLAATKVFIGESPSGKAPDFDSGIRRFDPYLPSQIVVPARPVQAKRTQDSHECAAKANSQGVSPVVSNREGFTCLTTG